MPGALLFPFFLVVIASAAWGQTAPGKYSVVFSDKSGSPYSLQRPGEFLSPECIARRVKQGIEFDARDLPVNPHYINALLAVGNVAEHHRSKWFNSVTVEILDTLLTASTLELISALPFVSEIRKVSVTGLSDDNFKIQEPVEPRTSNLLSGDTSIYGPSFRQIGMLNGHLLHQLGYTGKGVRVAVFDAGFTQADALPAFEHVHAEGRVAGVRDFVNPRDPQIFSNSTHGTFVWSHMAGVIPDSLVGTAPDAWYYLFRTEAVGSEYRVEEDNWVAAAELADSLGVDIINSSLGYSIFQDSTMNYSYADMNGSTARSTLAADIASEKGILVINSAGNQGAGNWRYITAPADGHLVMAVGATNSSGNRAWFSSFGPSADGRIKPDVVAMGQQTVFADLDGGIRTGNGTSFSAPVISGLAACLMQAFPNKPAREIYRAIIESANYTWSPNDSMGYGIPDFYRAFRFLAASSATSGPFDVKLFPNPAADHIRISGISYQNEIMRAEVRDIAGRTLMKLDSFVGPIAEGYFEGRIDIRQLSDGMYFIVLRAGEVVDVIRFLKSKNN